MDKSLKPNPLTLFQAVFYFGVPMLAGLIGVHIFLIIKHGESAFPDKED